MSTRKSFIKSAGVISIATAASRILGFLRDVLIAGLFGTKAAAEAFVVAFRIPNLLRDLVGEGATNAAFIPVLTEYRTIKGEREFLKLAGTLLNILLVVLMALTILGIIVAPLVVRIIAPGFSSDPAKLALTVKLARIIFPFILFIGLSAYCMAILNSLNHFSLPAIGPCLFNIGLIASILVLCPQFGVFGLALGVLLGGALQLAIQVPSLYRRGIRVNFRRGFSHPAVRKILRLLGPRSVGAGIYQINLFVDTLLASLHSIVGVGAVAAIYYANRVIQLPLAVFAIAIAQVALPAMSAQAASGDLKAMKETFNFSLRGIAALMIPAAVGIMVLAGPITQVLFQRGAFDTYSTQISSFALFFYCLGLFSYGGVKVASASFYALMDTITPLKVAAAAVVINIILNCILMWPLKVGGLALASSLSATFNFFALSALLRRRIGGLGARRILNTVCRVAAAAAIMGLVVYLMAYKMGGMGGETALGLLRSIAVGLVIFLIAGFILRVEELRSIIKWILKRN